MYTHHVPFTNWHTNGVLVSNNISNPFNNKDISCGVDVPVKVEVALDWSRTPDLEGHGGIGTLDLHTEVV